jgi:GH24 family phage-related lysozyme (muramidase)
MRDKVIKLIKHGEGYESRPYQCTGKKWTWGIGRCYETYPLTLNERFKVSSVCKMMIDPKETWTLDQTTFILSNIDEDKCELIADYFLDDVLNEIMPRLEKRFEWWFDVTDARRAAWIDWTYNMGYGQISGWNESSAMMKNKQFEVLARKAYDYQWAFQVGRKPPSPHDIRGQRAFYICKMIATGDWPTWIN